MKQPQPPTFAARVGRATTELRERAKLTKQELAEHLGVDPKIVRNIEDGLHPQTCGQHLDALARAFGVSVAALVLVKTKEESHDRKPQREMGSGPSR